jgi:hypothetical protein
METPSLKSPYDSVYPANHDQVEAAAPDRLPLQLIFAMHRDGEIERIRIVRVKRNGQRQIAFIWRYTNRKFKLHDESCTMGPRVMEKLVDALWAGRPCMLTPQ